jgi:SRSO17 transposase
MKLQTLHGLETRLTHFLEDLLEPMGRRERRHWARVYVQGLLLDGERKSIEPMASRIEGADVQALRQFVGQSPWAVEEVQRRLAHKVVDLLSEAEVWIIDETSFPKAGRHSVGVARQYCGTLCAASIIFADRDNYFCRLWPRLIDSVRLHFIVYR